MSASTNTELGCNNEEESDVRRGPWTLEEDSLLIHCIARHGEGRWNMLAKTAGLKRTGKSCRLRWLNYLKPDIKRGNLTPQEQLLILELHSKWGNRWSKIAQHLPGRTDNEIKNYWRTRVQKQARQLNIESDSDRFMDALRGFWMPRLLQKMEQNSSSSSSSSSSVTNSVPSLNPPPQRDLTFTHVVAPNNHTNNSYNNHCPDHCFLEFQNPLEISENPSSSSAAAATSEVPPYGYVFENYDDTNSVSYGMESINLEAFSVMEAFNGVSSSHFDFSQSSSSSSSQSDWVLSTIGGGLWNMDGM